MSVIKEIAIFLMITDLLYIMMNHESYQKYLKIFSGLILILMIIRLVTGFLSGHELEEEIEDRLMEYSIVEVDKSLDNVEQNAGDTMKSIYEEKTSKNIKAYLEANDIDIEEVTVEFEVTESALEFKNVTITPASWKVSENDWEEIAQASSNRHISELKRDYICKLLEDRYEIDRECIEFNDF